MHLRTTSWPLTLVGLKPAFVPRPMEREPDNPPNPTPDPSFDMVAKDFVDLADQLNS